MLYCVYYAAFVKDPSTTGALPTPYKIVDVKSESAPVVATAEPPAQQQAMSFNYQPSAPPPGGSNRNDPPVEVKTKKVIICNCSCYYNYY